MKSTAQQNMALYELGPAFYIGRYSVAHRTTQSDVCIKALQLSPDPQLQRLAMRQFQAEYRTLAALAHPNLPRVLDYIEENGQHYIVMENVLGCSLAAYLQSCRQPPPVPLVLSWFAQLASALSMLHRSGVLLRDLTPQSIMITPSGVLKLMEFGVARVCGRRTGFRAVGNAHYAPPEQFSLAQTDARLDIYVLGCVLYHAATLVVPPSAVDRSVRGAGLRPIHNGVPWAVARAFYWMMEIDADCRPNQVDDVMQDVMPHLQRYWTVRPDARVMEAAESVPLAAPTSQRPAVDCPMRAPQPLQPVVVERPRTVPTPTVAVPRPPSWMERLRTAFRKGGETAHTR